MIVPQVNLNGSSKQDLLDQQEGVYYAAIALIEKLAAAAPHGRDYQTMPEGSYQLARKKWEEQLKQAMNIQNTASNMLVAIFEQGN